MSVKRASGLILVSESAIYPKVVMKSIVWIKENIKEGNRNLLFSGLDLLEFDKNLWFIGIW